MNIVVNSTFNPFTYELLIKPLEDYTEEYNKTEQAYSDLSLQTEAFKDIATRDQNPIAYGMFSNYTNDLNNVLDDFSKGMTLTNRRLLLNLRRRYASEIAPIARANDQMLETLKYRRDLLSRDNSVRFKDEDLRLDNFLNGLRVNDDYISGNEVMARVSAEAELLARNIMSNPEFDEILNGLLILVYQQNGLTLQMFNDIVNNNLNNTNISKSLRELLRGFRELLDREVRSVSDYSLDTQLYVLDKAISGLYAGFAKPVYNFIKNGEYIDAASRQSLALDRERLDLELDRFKLLQEEHQISLGLRPYYIDPNSGTAYYSVGDKEWTVEDDGTSTLPTLKNPRQTTITDPKIYWQAGSTEDDNIKFPEYTEFDYNRLPEVNTLTINLLGLVLLTKIRKMLTDKGLNPDHYKIYNIDNNYWLIPNYSTALSNGTGTTTSTSSNNDDTPAYE